MNELFSKNDRIGDIVVRFPDAAEVFKQYHIDYCCGGNRPLQKAAQEDGIDERELLDKLANAYAESEDSKNSYIDWQKASAIEIIEHIINKHHNYLKKELPNILSLTGTILRAHGASHGEELSRVHELVGNLKTDMEEHLAKEEELVFPVLREYETHPTEELLWRAQTAIRDLEQEHEQVGNILKELRHVTKDFKVPEDGCPTYSATFKKLEELESDTFSHVHIENNVLFKKYLS